MKFSKEDFDLPWPDCWCCDFGAQEKMAAIANAKLTEWKVGGSEREANLLGEVERLRRALNRIAMLGCSEHAYTSEFTEKVNEIARGVLEKK